MPFSHEVTTGINQGREPNATLFTLCERIFHPPREHRHLHITTNRLASNESLLAFYKSRNEAVPETRRAAARKWFAAEFISVGPGFCTNRHKASNVVQKRCCTEMNSAVDEHTRLLRSCSLCFSKRE